MRGTIGLAPLGGWHRNWVAQGFASMDAGRHEGEILTETVGHSGVASAVCCQLGDRLRGYPANRAQGWPDPCSPATGSIAGVGVIDRPTRICRALWWADRRGRCCGPMPRRRWLEFNGEFMFVNAEVAHGGRLQYAVLLTRTHTARTCTHLRIHACGTGWQSSCNRALSHFPGLGMS